MAETIPSTGGSSASLSAARIRILIVEDHPLMRRAISAVVKGQDWDICGESASASTALRLARELRPDLMIIDLTLDEGNGIELMKNVRAEVPSVRMIALSMHDEMLYAERAVRAGAMGYVSKQAPPEVIVKAIEQVLSGQIYLSPKIESHLLSQVPRRSRKSTDGGPVGQLSDRELQTFEMIGRGMTTRSIAEQLAVSVKTIDAYRQRIKSKLKLQTSNELMRRAVEWTLERG